MKTITLKADDYFDDLLTLLAKDQETSKSNIIRQSVIYYKKVLEKRKMEQQLQNAAMMIREQTAQYLDGFDDSIDDGLI